MTSKKPARRPESEGIRELFDAFDTHDFSQSSCFLCGQKLNSANRSDEHVFPLWLIRRFNLHNEKLVLLNGTSIPYRQLKIPCCKVCNNQHLSALERAVRRVVEGELKISTLSKKILYLWASKIFYGLLYREVLLPFDRVNPSQGPIIQPDVLRGYRLLHIFLQSARLKMKFECFDASFPASVFIFKLQEPRTPAAKFDFKDDINLRAIYLRLGSIGILAAFDAGAQAVEWSSLYQKYTRYKLHPLQFEELGAAMFCKASLFDRVPKLIMSGDSRRGYHVMVMPLQGMSAKSVFRPWDGALFARYLSHFTGMPIDHLTPDGGSRVMTFLRGPGSKRFKAIKLSASPWRGLR